MNDTRLGPRIAITPGEPAGIGPDITLSVVASRFPAQLVVIGDPDLLRARSRLLGCDFEIPLYSTLNAESLSIEPIRLRTPVTVGVLDICNAAYVLETLDRAIDGCLSREFDAVVTGPVQKSVINDAGYAFSGHTEYLANRVGCKPVMMLVADKLRVALATTHLPLREVPDALTVESVGYVIRSVGQALATRFGVPRPRLVVCGLNPHAGEHGHLGREDIEIIAPAIEAARREGLNVTGPASADTVFAPLAREQFDAFVCMYHDQGLPVLKALGFGNAVNVTLGLPFIRTSVDHGTALDLAGTGRAISSSLHSAIELAISLHEHAARH
ncbi:MAG: 4-hydroxythreonine-4-phosphate dehydrogenase PdxA [Gammaproteobacteria bacterium]|nr:4-hydroxythreonine-4-phosphate dehydrogenase PdxA [Gammaproteobacteria bacterium]